MTYNVLQYLERSAERFPDRVAVSDETEEFSWRQLMENAQRIGTWIIRRIGNDGCRPVAVLIDRNVQSVCAFLGVVYSGNFYVPIDPAMPESRIQLIYDTLHPVLTINTANTGAFQPADAPVWQEVMEEDADESLLERIRSHAVDVDPLYAIFTSGSTGVPKGVLISHRSVIDLVNAFDDAFELPEDAIFANQAPFDFDVSVKDIYLAMSRGATVHIVPKKLFKTPKLLVDYLREKRITVMIWAVSALRILADFKALEETADLALQTVMFSGEVMPPRALNYWMDHVPQARYVNLYGPTEITCNCTYYPVERRFRDDEALPVGRPFRNTRVFLWDDERNLITKPGIIGEICVGGTCLALGYFGNAKKTEEVFVRDSAVPAWESRVYRTGDMGYYNEEGELFFASRRDHQIKHMGHRIELGEIEAALNAMDFLTIACCVYDASAERIICHYQASEDQKKKIVGELAKKLPKYMWPNIYIRHDSLPLNKNGKIDRIELASQMKTTEGETKNG